MTASQDLPRTSREVRLTAVPDGLPRPEHLRVVEQPLPRPGEGEVLVRNTYFQVFPALRTLIGGGAEGAPFPGLRPGDALFGPAVGEVVERPGPAGPPVGAPVSHFLGWREYAVVPAAECTLLDGGALPDRAAHLSQGSLAYTASPGSPNSSRGRPCSSRAVRAGSAPWRAGSPICWVPDA